jgi:hypothetical protein
MVAGTNRECNSLFALHTFFVIRRNKPVWKEVEVARARALPSATDTKPKPEAKGPLQN